MKKTEQNNDLEKKRPTGPTPELGQSVPRGGVRRAVRAELVGV
jgi:hypothetical protein